MAKCAICGKEKKFGNIVTFSHRRLNRSWAPNLRRVRAVVDGHTKELWHARAALNPVAYNVRNNGLKKRLSLASFLFT